MKKEFLLLMAFCFLFASCEKDELPVEPHIQGPVTLAQVDMGPAYINQVYYSLDNEEIAGSKLFTEWDLAFESSEDGWKVVLNDARMMSAWTSGFNSITEATDSAGFGNGQRIEVSATAYTEPVMGNWREIEKVYLLDLGYSQLGLPLGLYWLEILDANASTYTIRTKKYGTNEIREAIIEKVANEGFTLYSILENTAISGVEEASWDIKFTKYTYQFIDPPQPYLVTGLVLNPNRTAAVEVLNQSFDELALSDTTGLNWSYQPDYIGYDWKAYDFNSSLYEVDSERSWLIRTASGFYYKFRFTDFYNAQGQVGVPGFEFVKL